MYLRMQCVKSIFDNEKKRFEQIVETTESRLKDAANGVLRIVVDGGYVKFYYSQKEDGHKKRVYISKQNDELINKLAQKAYDEKVCKLAKRRLAQLKTLAAEYQDDEIEKIYLNEHPERRKRIEPVEEPWDDFVKKWKGESYQGKDFSDSASYIMTENAEKVRSKSEKIIADYLFRNGIAYKYESPLHLKGIGIVYPDFTLLSPITRKEIYWEHCGMMDTPAYASSAIKKISAYEKNGFFPGEQLILTFETGKNPIESDLIECIVEKYF